MLGAALVLHGAQVGVRHPTVTPKCVSSSDGEMPAALSLAGMHPIMVPTPGLSAVPAATWEFKQPWVY